MKYNVIKAQFIERINRFVAIVAINGVKAKAHVPNTGRLTELFVFGAICYVQKSNNPQRKTKYSLIAIEKEGRVFNIDSQGPNKILYNALINTKETNFNIPSSFTKELPDIMGSFDVLKREVTYQRSRFDLYFKDTLNNREGFIEVKGVTLEKENIASFPASPTIRGQKHLDELIDAKKKGYDSFVVFIIQFMNPIKFTPCWDIDPVFSEHLVQAQESGVHILAYDTIVKPDSMKLNRRIPIDLRRKS
ncbi:MAG: DNA/RNA nuclease SfsA [Tissierellia bacterium]|nr:DNA/RNA nuclease SfsA [Tissierellia bacterium]